MLKQKRMDLKKINELFQKKYPTGSIFINNNQCKNRICVVFSQDGKVYEYPKTSITQLAVKLGLVISIDLFKFYCEKETVQENKFFKTKNIGQPIQRTIELNKIRVETLRREITDLEVQELIYNNRFDKKFFETVPNTWYIEIV